MKSRLALMLCTVLAAVPLSLSAQTWTNAGGNNEFSDPANWSPGGVPGSGANITIGSNDYLMLDMGNPYQANSLTVAAGVEGHVIPAGAETLKIGAGGLTLHGISLLLEIPVLVETSQTWNLGSGSLIVGFAMGVHNSAMLTIEMQAGASIEFRMSYNPMWTGQINFVGDISAASLRVTGLGLSAQNISQITINGVAAQLSDGVLTAIPEPSTYALMAGVLGLAATGYRRWRRETSIG